MGGPARARAATCVAVFALVLVVACAPARTAPPSPSRASAVRGAADTVVLQQEDVPAGYEIETDDEMSAEELSGGLSVSPGILKERGAAGYVRSFKDQTDPFRCCLIDSILITTLDQQSALAVFADFRQSALALGSTETDLGETVGDDSRVLVFQQPTTDGDLITITVLFRYLNVVDAVEVTGRPGSFERPYVLEFAKKQLARLRADAERT